MHRTPISWLIIVSLLVVASVVGRSTHAQPALHTDPDHPSSILHPPFIQSLTLRIDRIDFAAHPVVHVFVTVRDANGVPVPDLNMDAFDVSEDRTLQSRPIQDVTTVVHEDTPVAVVLVIDTSGSMKDQPLADAKAAATRFVDRLKPGDKAAILAFHDEVRPFPDVDPTRELDFTSDKAALYQVIDGLTAGGNTPLYDAAYKAVQWAARQPAGNRAVLLLTDGQDEVAGQGKGSGSKVANEDSAIREANRAHIPVFTIGLGEQRDEAYLKRLAAETGGEYQAAPNSGQLAALFGHVLDRLKQQYRLTYTSAVQPDGRTHKTLVTVKVAGVSAFDEAEWGPLGKEGQPIPAPPATATPATMPSASPTPASTPAPPPPQQPRPAGLDWTWLLVGGGCLAALVLIGAIVVIRLVWPRRTESPRCCLNCGYQLKEGETYCPHCGPDVKTFRRPS